MIAQTINAHQGTSAGNKLRLYTHVYSTSDTSSVAVTVFLYLSLTNKPINLTKQGQNKSQMEGFSSENIN